VLAASTSFLFTLTQCMMGQYTDGMCD